MVETLRHTSHTTTTLTAPFRSDFHPGGLRRRRFSTPHHGDAEQSPAFLIRALLRVTLLVIPLVPLVIALVRRFRSARAIGGNDRSCGCAPTFRQPSNRRAEAGGERRTTPVPAYRRPIRIAGVEVCASPVHRGAAA